MSLSKCLNDKVLAGKLTREQADEVLDRVKRYEREIGGGVSSAEAIAKAAKETIENAERGEKNAVRKIVAQEVTLNWANSHEKGIGAGVAAVLGRDWYGKAKHENVASAQMAVKNLLHGTAADLIETYRPKIGLRARDPEGLRAIIFENYGKSTGNGNAAAASKGYKEANDLGIELLQEGGGRIHRRENFYQPQKPNQQVVKELGEEKYTELMLGALADGKLKITDWKTGGAVSPERATEIIKNAYKRISTNGLSDIVPGERNRIPLASRIMERRVFEWTTPEAWLWQNETFGLGEAHIFEVLTSHLDDMAQDIGLLRILGPDPEATANVLIDTAKKAGHSGYLLESMYDQLTGAAHVPVNAGVANFMRSLRELMSSAQLGSALLSTTGDFVTASRSAAWMGLPQTKLANEYVSLLSPASRADRTRAARTAFIAESFTTHISAIARGQMDDLGSGLTARLADISIRASGLTAHTDALKMAFQRTAMANLADLSGRQFDNLPKEPLRFFEAHGIVKADWDNAVKHGLVDYGDGVKFIEPLAMVRSGDKAARDSGIKIFGALLEETNIAVPTPGVRERALIVGTSRPGTAGGELLRSVGQYKGFMVSLMSGHGMRAIEELKAGRGAYISSLAVGLTAAGALTIQLKAIAQGKDPREMFGDPATSGKFWTAAFIQGGGAGIFGDFLYSSVTRGGTTPYSTFVGGPVGGLFDQLIYLGASNFEQVMKDKDTNFGAELATITRRHTPGSSLWYARLALDRLFFDQLHKQLDPDYNQRFARQEQRAREEYGQRYYWRPGQAEPSRGPDFGAMVQ